MSSPTQIRKLSNIFNKLQFTKVATQTQNSISYFLIPIEYSRNENKNLITGTNLGILGVYYFIVIAVSVSHLRQDSFNSHTMVASIFS